MLTRIPLLAILVVVIIGIVLLIVLLVPGGNHVNSDDSPTVETPVGFIQGLKAYDGEYDLFLGIPYAIVNASNHFGASTPYPKFDDVFVANSDSARCPQIVNDESVGDINCLQLNIFVPHSASDDHRLPVMVWIDGKDFQTSWKAASQFGPKHLLRHDVIYVSINYRVGPYGFMCLDIPEVPGNQGLKDQVLALRWVRDNIQSFGGDENSITAFGSSAGGQSIDFHILSDTEPLFKNAILQSGSSLSSNVFIEHNKAAPIFIAARIGYSTNSVLDAISYLSSIDSNSVLQASEDLGLDFKPCTEQKFDNVEPFLTRSWITADKPKARGMPILIGYNEQEQLLNYVNPNVFENIDIVREKLEKTFVFDEEKLLAMERNVRNFYFGDKPITPELMWQAINFDTDYTYAHPIHRSISKYLESGAVNVFFYIFSYSGGRNVAKLAANVTIGSAAHEDETGYLFDMETLQNEPSTDDQLMIDRMTTMWTNFAKYSDPTPETSNLLPVNWPAITDDSFNYLSINSNVTVSRRPEHARMSFLSLLFKYAAEYQTGYSAT